MHRQPRAELAETPPEGDRCRQEERSLAREINTAAISDMVNEMDADKRRREAADRALSVNSQAIPRHENPNAPLDDYGLARILCEISSLSYDDIADILVEMVDETRAFNELVKKFKKNRQALRLLNDWNQLSG